MRDMSMDRGVGHTGLNPMRSNSPMTKGQGTSKGRASLHLKADEGFGARLDGMRKNTSKKKKGKVPSREDLPREGHAILTAHNRRVEARRARKAGPSAPSLIRGRKKAFSKGRDEGLDGSHVAGTLRGFSPNSFSLHGLNEAVEKDTGTRASKKKAAIGLRNGLKEKIKGAVPKTGKEAAPSVKKKGLKALYAKRHHGLAEFYDTPGGLEGKALSEGLQVDGRVSPEGGGDHGANIPKGAGGGTLPTKMALQGVSTQARAEVFHGALAGMTGKNLPEKAPVKAGPGKGRTREKGPVHVKNRGAVTKGASFPYLHESSPHLPSGGGAVNPLTESVSGTVATGGELILQGEGGQVSGGREGAPGEVISLPAHGVPPETGSSGIKTPPAQGLGIRHGALIKKAADGLLMSLSRGRREVVLDLEPEELGRMKIRVSIEKRVVRASFIVDHPHVLSALNAGAHALRDHLEKQGFAFGGIDVELNHKKGLFEGRKEGFNQGHGQRSGSGLRRPSHAGVGAVVRRDIPLSGLRGGPRARGLDLFI